MRTHPLDFLLDSLFDRQHEGKLVYASALRNKVEWILRKLQTDNGETLFGRPLHSSLPQKDG